MRIYGVNSTLEHRELIRGATTHTPLPLDGETSRTPSPQFYAFSVVAPPWLRPRMQEPGEREPAASPPRSVPGKEG